MVCTVGRGCSSPTKAWLLSNPTGTSQGKPCEHLWLPYRFFLTVFVLSYLLLCSSIPGVSRWSSQPTRAPGKRLASGLASSSGHVREDVRCHLEANLASAVVLGQPPLYRRSLQAYCRQLADFGDEGRLREVINASISFEASKRTCLEMEAPPLSPGVH